MIARIVTAFKSFASSQVTFDNVAAGRSVW